jgi:phosphate acetyltransferase
MCLEDRVSEIVLLIQILLRTISRNRISSADSSLAFGIEPKIAMLSYSSGSSGKGDEVDKVRTATEIVRKNARFKIEGPIQYDAAVDMAVGKVKCQIQKWQDKPAF